MNFLVQAIFRIFRATFFLRNLESSNLLKGCEYKERKTPSKSILEFLRHFSSRSHYKQDHPVYKNVYTYKIFFISQYMDDEKKKKQFRKRVDHK